VDTLDASDGQQQVACVLATKLSCSAQPSPWCILPLPPLAPPCSPVVRVAVEPKVASDLPKLVEGEFEAAAAARLPFLPAGWLACCCCCLPTAAGMSAAPAPALLISFCCFCPHLLNPYLLTPLCARRPPPRLQA